MNMSTYAKRYGNLPVMGSQARVLAGPKSRKDPTPTNKIGKQTLRTPVRAAKDSEVYTGDNTADIKKYIFYANKSRRSP
jgi:hypothetical protein